MNVVNGVIVPSPFSVAYAIKEPRGLNMSELQDFTEHITSIFARMLGEKIVEVMPPVSRVSPGGERVPSYIEPSTHKVMEFSAYILTEDQLREIILEAQKPFIA